MDEDVFKIRKDIDRARSIFDIAQDRLSLVKIYPREKTYKIIEEYYESIKEFLTSLMYIEGYKTLSHIGLINWFKKRKIFSVGEIRLIDKLRRLRNGTLYYGEKVNKIFLEENEKDIFKIVNKLIKLLEKIL